MLLGNQKTRAWLRTGGMTKRLHSFRTGSVALSALSLLLTGCETTSHQYAGPARPLTDVASIAGVSVVESKAGRPDIVMNTWKIDGAAPKSDLSVTRMYALLPGRHEVGVSLALVTLLPMTLRRFSGTYWVPFEAEAGYTYLFYADHQEGGAKPPRQVCALRIAKEAWPLQLAEDMQMPSGVTVAGCGTPRQALEHYELRMCSGVGSCPITDEYVKP